MATTTTDVQFAVPSYPESQRPGIEMKFEETDPSYGESRISLQDEQPDTAPYIDSAALYDAQRAAVEAAQPSKVEAQPFNPEAIFAFVEGAGERIAGLRKHYVALQDENFMDILRNKSIN